MSLSVKESFPIQVYKGGKLWISFILIDWNQTYIINYFKMPFILHTVLRWKKLLFTNHNAEVL